MTAKRVYTDAEVDAIVATHTAIAAAHHTKYTDAEAVAAVESGDDYIKNTGDTITGTLVSTKVGAGGGFDVQDQYNIFRVASGGEWFGWGGETYAGAAIAWFGGRAVSGKGELMYFLYGGASDGCRLTIAYDNIIVEKNLLIKTVKSGSTQANAGAAANEVWKTNGHASLPDNVLMIGI